MFNKIKNNTNIVILIGFIFIGICIITAQFLKQHSIQKENRIERVQDCYDKGYTRYYYDSSSELCRFIKDTPEGILERFKKGSDW
jgi:cell division protein FtsL